MSDGSSGDDDRGFIAQTNRTPAATSAAELVCVRCGGTRPQTTVNARCDACGEPFEVRYAIGSVSLDRAGSDQAGHHHPHGPSAPTVFDEYPAFYPFLTVDPAISLGEGRTTLLRSRQAGRELGLDHLFFKNETENPTWTSRIAGRRAAFSMPRHLVSRAWARCRPATWARRWRRSRAGRAWDPWSCSGPACPARRSTPSLSIRATSSSSRATRMASTTRRSRPGRRCGSISAWPASRCASRATRRLHSSCSKQLGRRAPDVVAVQVGSGGLCRGIVKGFEELRAAGLTDRLPAFPGVQPEGCSPIADAYERGFDRIEPFQNPRTLDHVLENPTPASGNALLWKMRSAGGTVIKVGHDAIIDAALRLAREGLFVQPASATALAGIVQRVARGAISRDAVVVSIVTGTGLKYPPALDSYGLTAAQSSTDGLQATLTGLLRL